MREWAGFAAVNTLWSLEPFRSYRSYFTVYTVSVSSSALPRDLTPRQWADLWNA